jgi:hypothetical protein
LDAYGECRDSEQNTKGFVNMSAWQSYGTGAHPAKNHLLSNLRYFGGVNY